MEGRAGDGQEESGRGGRREELGVDGRGGIEGDGRKGRSERGGRREEVMDGEGKGGEGRGDRDGRGPGGEGEGVEGEGRSERELEGEGAGRGGSWEGRGGSRPILIKTIMWTRVPIPFASVLPRLLLQGAAPCPLFGTTCPFEKSAMTPCPFD